MNKTAIIVLLFFMLFLTPSCKSAPEIPLEKSAAEMIQQAQAYTDVSNYKAAEKVYQTIIQRYGTDMSMLITAEFELAHIKIKNKKYTEAEPMLRKVLSYFETGNPSELPNEYKKLAQIDLDKIEAHKNKGKK